jgi:hypothetical protein
MNDVTKVTTGKPKVTGAIWRAPFGSTLPTNATAELDTAFKCLGYCSEDGLTNNNSPETENIKAWGGDVVLTPLTEKLDTFSYTLIEAINVEVLKSVYGDANVTGDLNTGITVRANSNEQDASAYVIDQIFKGGVLKRIVIPNATLSELSEIVYKDDEAVGYGVTLNAMTGGFPDGDPDTHKEYIVQPASTPASTEG